MASVNQTWLHCVNQMGKTHSKPLAARHGKGTARYAWICLQRSLQCRFHIRVASAGKPMWYGSELDHIIYLNTYLFPYSWVHTQYCIKNVNISYIPISRPTDATCDRFLFSIYMCITPRFERQALIIRSPSPYIQPPVSVFVSVCSTVL
jgi:hypothetical protein